jgi:hypothetical protein
MRDAWKRMGAIAVGGTVLSVSAGADGQTWLASGGGIQSAGNGLWRPPPQPVPMEQVGLVASAGADWYVTGLSGGLILTWDGGRSWASPWIDEVTEPITCIVVSATYEKDITLLAGTSGAGVLRSTDGGRRWRLSNFGLQEFSILALATAGDWSRRQVVFAGTADGVYRSSGGGRAWKPVGLKGFAVQALATGRRPPPETQADQNRNTMPDASGAWAILAGTEDRGLHRSLDGGHTWEPCGQEIGDESGINALLCLESDGAEVWLAGTDGGSIWRSTDNGETWKPVCELDGPVLSLAESHESILAGTSEHGLWASTDRGVTWQPDATLCAWGFRRIDCETDGRVAALAPTGGVWLSTNAGETWQRTLEATLYDPVLAHVTAGDGWLVARAEGVWRGQPSTEPVLVLQAGEAPIVALAETPAACGTGTSQRAVWAGTSDASLWSSSDGGLAWQPIEVPFQGQRLLGIAFSSEDGTPLVGLFAEQKGEVSLWRRDGTRWQCWLSRADTWPGLALCAGGRLAEMSWAALGGRAYSHTQNGWQEVEITGSDGGVAAITGLSSRGARYLLRGDQVLCRDQSGDWQSLPLPADAATPVDLCLVPSTALLCLDAAGVVWRLAV